MRLLRLADDEVPELQGSWDYGEALELSEVKLVEGNGQIVELAYFE